MKQALTHTIVISLLAVFILGAAQLSINQTSITISAKPTKGFSTNFVVSNNGSVNLSSVAVALSSTELSKFNISFSPSSFNINVNSSQSVTLSGTIPKDVNTRLSPFDGTITVSNSQASQSVSLKVTALSQLNLDNVKILVDGKSKSVDDGDTVRDVLPGSKIVVKGDIENTYSDDDDIDIEDVEITVTIEDIDDDDDLEEEDDVGDIQANEEESFRVEFEIPEDVDEDNYKIRFEVSGDDENGAKHFFELRNVDLEIEKDKHDIQIRKISVTPSKITCSRSISVNVGLKNQGRTDEDEVVVRLENADLGIDLEDTSIPEIEEGTGSDTEFDKRYNFNIGDDVEPGIYAISVKTFFDTDDLSDVETADLEVGACSLAITPTPTAPRTDDTTVVITQPIAEPRDSSNLEIITTPVTATTESSLTAQSPLLLIIGGGALIGLLVIIGLVYVLYSTKKRE